MIVDDDLLSVSDRRTLAVFDDALNLNPVSRNPTRLSPETMTEVLATPLSDRLGRFLRARTGEPAVGRISVIVVTYNQLAFSRLCLESVLANSSMADLEVIVVDNGSHDGTPHYLAELAALTPSVRPLLNAENRGFAQANNQGLAESTGDVLILLNNDTIVPPDWDARLVRHLKHSDLGLVGPLTNRTCNEAQLATDYTTYGGLVELADRLSEIEAGTRFEIGMLAMFCVAMRRDVWNQLGPIDERFGLGLFEDDDYARRAKAAGYRVVCARDAFVHHFGQASFGALNDGEYGRLWHHNRAMFEAKWQESWSPHSQRTDAYRMLVDRLRTAVRLHLPEGATAAVVSKGDEDLLDLGTRRAWHFPCDEAGSPLGHHPADGAQAVGHLLEWHRRGVEYLVIPAPQFWYLDFYQDLRTWLEESCPPPVRIADTCLIFDLRRLSRNGLPPYSLNTSSIAAPSSEGF
ncbi:glycosyltransferase family 2 protein [Singulisphaera acidiphila]|nr:glycosyltransferase family 2 protein [Singulisphaera acidiphila]